MAIDAKNLLSVTGVLEAATGLALLVVPSLVGELLLGVPPGTAAGIAVSRVAGAALLALGVACWQTRDEGAGQVRRGLVAGMLFYNVAVAFILVLTWTSQGLAGIALWPAVLAHAGLAAWCISAMRP